jgi:CDP-glucose 4,6-dehydratase
VQWIVEQMVQRWGDDARWQLDGGEHPHEANYLKLDISKAQARLGWRPRWSLGMALENITTWHQAWLAREDVRALCLAQIEQYTNTEHA